MYDIGFSHTAEKQLNKLDQETQIRIISALERIRIRPYPYVKKLVGSPYFRLRTGQYRVIIDIKDKELLIYAIEIGHRKSIYKRF